MMRAKDSATGETIELPVRGGPPLIFSVPVAGIGPGIIRHASPGERGVVGLYQVRPEYTEEDMKPPTLNPDQKITWTTKVDVQAFGQVLAKTAHAFAVACLGQGAFQPLLLDYILGDEVGFNTYLIGDAGPQPPIGKLHQLSMKGVVPLDAKGRRQSPLGLYAVEVRLFAHLPTPTYLVVVGQRLPSVSSPLWSGRVRV